MLILKQILTTEVHFTRIDEIIFFDFCPNSKFCILCTRISMPSVNVGPLEERRAFETSTYVLYSLDKTGLLFSHLFYFQFFPLDSKMHFEERKEIMKIILYLTVYERVTSCTRKCTNIRTV